MSVCSANLNDRSRIPTITREALAQMYGCSHGDLGRLLRERLCPLPVRVEGAILWFSDEVEQTKEKVLRILARRATRH